MNARRLLATIVLAVTLATPGVAAADSGGPPTIPAEASIPQAPESITPDAPTPSPVGDLAATGSDNLPLVGAGLALVLGGVVLAGGSRRRVRR